MSNLWEPKRFPSDSLKAVEDGEDIITMFDMVYGRMNEEVVLQQLIMVARLPFDPADRTELGARYENFNVHLCKQHMWDQGITGLLLIYPSCLLHVIEASEHILDCFLKDLQATQQHADFACLEAKIVFMSHNLESRQFQQWSYMVLDAGLVARNPVARRPEEDEESIESLVSSVLTPLQKLVLPGSVLDENPELLIPPVILENLLGRDELLSPQQYLEMYQSPLNISIEFGQANLESYF
ncbi:hypothetical protein ATANTOWER_009071 [Ataeniobius toweri]|uniref:BLUF domain-containing protein n=1 Tax=Ataeniobius toweri TaxID=208326 RepID=A0ABU7AP44_9TELE|nr:hypothetical protein [Ataeniobius toweri]